MAKKTYLYRMLIGNNGNADVDIFLYARNSKVATEFCKELYRSKKYNYYKAIKVGISLKVKETGLVTKEEDEKLRKTIAVSSNIYSEREVTLPTFISKEEAGDLNI